MWWTPDQTWRGQDAYVIGGGPSLVAFDWELLRHENTVGCNSAFILGAHICNVVLFADFEWWDKIGKKQLPEYGGIVVSICDRLVYHKKPIHVPSWVHLMQRNPVKHLGTGHMLGWYGNTGACAINLALNMGAKRVFLLGFDMKMKTQPNWHNLRHQNGRREVYARFLNEFKRFSKSAQKVYPDREIINVTDDSDLIEFPKVSLEEHFGARRTA